MDFHEVSLESLWDFCGISLQLLKGFYGGSMGFFGIFMGLLWHPSGISMMFLLISLWACFGISMDFPKGFSRNSFGFS